MPDVFQQIKQKSGFGDLIDTVHQVLFRGKPLKNFKDISKDIDRDLDYLSKHPKTTAEEFAKAQGYDLPTAKRVLDAVAKDGGGKWEGSTFIPAPDLDAAVSRPSVPATRTPSATPSGTPSATPSGTPSATPSGTSTAPSTVPPADPAMEGTFVDKIIKLLEAGRGKASKEAIDKIAPNASKNHMRNVRKKLRGAGWDVRWDNPTKMYILFKPNPTANRRDSWVSELIQGEASRLAMLHRASIISPQSVQSPLNER